MKFYNFGLYWYIVILKSCGFYLKTWILTLIFWRHCVQTVILFGLAVIHRYCRYLNKYWDWILCGSGVEDDGGKQSERHTATADSGQNHTVRR